MNKLYKHTAIFFLLLLLSGSVFAQKLISETPTPNSVDLTNLYIYVDDNDEALVKRSAALLQSDIEKVTGKTPLIGSEVNKMFRNIIVIGTLARSSFLKQLVERKKFNPKEITGKWEAYKIQTVAGSAAFMPMQNMLVIAGSDRRGAAYGVFELSKQIGVSPWYWWADVPVKKRTDLYAQANVTLTDAPKVKYRGIFINDEAPALSNWSKEKFGGFNHSFYEKVFELMLRLKANYLWPAMWGNAFYDDDPLNIKSADEYGIVIGTSHHEPLMRAHDEWRRYNNKQKWNYDSTEAGLKAFWRGGMQRAINEKIVSVGMRGDGDEPMSRETATALLERIVKDQRQIIKEVTGKPASETPQLWALYKEVQDYYDKGMRVPDDVTLLLCDDNWGNIRKLPALNERPRKGGYGIYYHFDYVGGPRNYKWINTNPLPRVWEQMHLAWEYNARQIWIVNVGDIKPMEFPISFFLDYAWNPEKIGANDLQQYTRQWVVGQFGPEHANDIAEIISTYSKYNGRRKPELLNNLTYNRYNYYEAENVTAAYRQLSEKAEEISKKLPVAYHDAYFQLVLHPVKAMANLYEMYYNVELNHEMYSSKYASANKYAAKAKSCFVNDSLITLQYHKLGNGKWNHMMDQTHIGYIGWQQPPANKMPELKYVSPEEEVRQVLSDTGIMRSPSLVPENHRPNSFYEEDRYISIEAAHYTKAVNTNGITWTLLPDHGKTGDAITPFPVTASKQKPGGNSPHVQYDFYTGSVDSFKVLAYFSPTLNFQNTEIGLQYAVSIDDEQPQIVSINKDDNKVPVWSNWVANNIIIKITNHIIKKQGKHMLKFWMVHPGVVLQKLVIDLGGLQPSYLGPPETIIK